MEIEEKLVKIREFYKRKRRMPSYSEVMKICGYHSKSGAHYFINTLIHEGILAKDGKGRILPKNWGEIKILGLVEAGFPTSASEELLDTMSLDEFLIENKEASYLLKVKGDSMIEAGILPGDLVIVERGTEPKAGDIVVAEVDGEYTLKYFRKKSGKPYLEAANSKYKDIYPKEDLRILAVLRAVVRKY